MRNDLINRMVEALDELNDLYSGVDEGRWPPKEAEEIRAEYRAMTVAHKNSGKAALSRSLRHRIKEMQDATRDGDGYPETKEILDRWNIGLNDLKIDAQDILAKTLERGRITSHLNYYVCRTQFERTSTLDPKTRNQLDHILGKFEQKWGA